jgi:hypothetical protein
MPAGADSRRTRSASLIAVAAALGVLTSGCGGAVKAAGAAVPGRLADGARPAPTASCVREPLAHAPLPQEIGVYRAGPLILAVGDDLAQHPAQWPGRRVSGSEAIAVLAGSRPTVLSVDRTSRDRLSLQFTPYGRGHPSPVLSDGTSAVRFPACAGRLHRFGGAILFRGAGCARLHVSEARHAPIPMLIPIGDTLRGCPAPSALRPLAPAALPFLGVSCPVPNSIACDRIGVGVHLTRAATLVVVRVAGRLVTLSPPTGPPPDDLWLGYLFQAGLRQGALNVHIPRGAHLWFGSPEVYPRVRVTAFFADGHAASLTGTVLLHPGFG